MQQSRFRLHGGFWIKGVCALIPVVVGDIAMFHFQMMGGTFGFVMAAFGVALILARPAVRRDWRAGIALGFAALYAFAVVYNPGLLALLLFLIAIGIASLLPGFARFGDGIQWVQRLLGYAVMALIGPFIDVVALAHARRRRPRSKLRATAIITAIFLPVVGCTIILTLFSAANPVIEQALGALYWPTFGDETIARIIIAAVVFAAAWAILRPRLSAFISNRQPTSYIAPNAIPGVSVLSVAISLILFNLLFFLQNAMDAVWLWGFAPLPDGMTLAQYAHRGAYPLIATAIFAAVFVLVTLRPGSETASVPLIRRLVVLWVAQNVFLVASSMLRTLDYVAAYSLTELRLYALVWMALVGVGLILICARMLLGKSAGWLINANLITSGLVLTTLCFVDASAVAAQWNVRHAREIDGTGAALDVHYLRNRGTAALIPLIDLSRRPLAPALNTQIREAIDAIYIDATETDHDGYHWWSLTHARRVAEAQRRLGPNYRPVDRSYMTRDTAPPPPSAAPSVAPSAGSSPDPSPIPGPVAPPTPPARPASIAPQTGGLTVGKER